MSRPRKSPAESRIHRLNLRFTAFEVAHLRVLAGAAGASVAGYARRAMLAELQSVERMQRHRGSTIDPAAVTALNRVGVNLNQLVRRANAGDMLQPGELPEVLAALHDQLTRIETLLLPAFDGTS